MQLRFRFDRAKMTVAGAVSFRPKAENTVSVGKHITYIHSGTFPAKLRWSVIWWSCLPVYSDYTESHILCGGL